MARTKRQALIEEVAFITGTTDDRIHDVMADGRAWTVAQIAQKAMVSPHTVRLYMNNHPDEYEKGFVAVESGHKPVAYRKRKEKKIGRSARR
jgi:hypothetical protein